MGQVTEQIIIMKMIVGGLGILLPIVGLLIWKKKTGARFMPAVVGAITFVVFAQILEGIPKFIFFTGDTPLTAYVWSHAWLYTLIGCLQAGIFEEVGRYAAFRFCLKKYQDRRDAITYGIGHGGFEVILVTGIAGLTSIGLAASINSGALEQSMSSMSLAQTKAVAMQVSALVYYGAGRMCLELLERVFAVTLHIALSVVVFKSVRDKKAGYLLAAIVLHAIFDIPAALCQCGVISMPVAELLLGVAAIGIGGYAYRVYGSLKREEAFTQQATRE